MDFKDELRQSTIRKLLDRHNDIITKSKKGKIEINFSDSKTNISITIFDEDNRVATPSIG